MGKKKDKKKKKEKKRIKKLMRNLESELKINIDGDRVWRSRIGEVHRLDGPAIEYPDGGKIWAINGWVQCDYSTAPRKRHKGLKQV